MPDVVRERLKVAGEKVFDEQKLIDALELAFNSTRRVQCKHCNRATPVPMPDFVAVEKILTQMYGAMPAPEQVVQHNVLVTAMSLDEKAALLESYRARALALTTGDEAA